MPVPIKNTKLFYLKNFGILIMLPIGIISVPIQFFYPQIFPYNAIWLGISALFQIIGFSEPPWVFAKHPPKKQKCQSQ